MKNKFQSIEEAERIITAYGGKIVDEKIYPVDLPPFSRLDKDRYYDAIQWLQEEHGYTNANSDPIYEFDDDEWSSYFEDNEDLKN